MLRNTINLKVHGPRRGFTIVEMMFAMMIGLFVIAAAWSAYVMIWQWWAEMSPRLDAQRTARITLLNVVEGVTGVMSGPDPVAGTFTVGATAYKRRNGLAWATDYPTIASGGKTVSYRLVPDSSNVRQFYLGTDPVTGEGVIYYRHSDGTAYKIPSTRGITDIMFEKFQDESSVIHDNIIKITVTAEKDVKGTRAVPFNIKVVYTDTVYLRNAL